MSFSAGTFSINSTGQPVVAGTTISASVFNALTSDLATGLSTCMLKDGTQTATAGIGFFAGTVSLPGIYFGTDTATGLYRIGLNNTGYSINGTKLLDLSSALVGITGALTVSTTTTLSGALTYGGVTLSNAVTGTGNMVLSASPTFTGTLGAAAITASSTLTLSGTAANIALGSNFISNGGTDAGLSLDASNNATFSAGVTASGVVTQGAASNEGLTIQPYTAGGYSAIYSRAITPGNTNFSYATNGATSYVNGTTSSILGVVGSNIVTATSAGASVTGTLGVSSTITVTAPSAYALIANGSATSGQSAYFDQKNTTATASAIDIQHEATTGDNIFIKFGTEASFTQRGSISYNRGGGLTAYNTTSDYRSKDVFGQWKDASSTLSALTVHDGRMKEATMNRPMLIAHEAQAIVPWAVTGTKDAVDKDGKAIMQQISEGALTPLLIAGWQDHESTLTELLAWKAKMEATQ